MSGEAATALPGEGRGGLVEARELAWRRPATAETLRRNGQRWTFWTCGVIVTFAVPSIALVALQPLALPVALLWSAHGWAICRMQPGRGVRGVAAIGSERSAAPGAGAGGSAQRMALGLLGDLVGHRERELLQRTGLALHRGRLGAWLVGEQGAIMVRAGGRRVDCWCVRVSEPEGLPAADRVAHLLLALREDESGFATVANLAFSGAPWRVRRPGCPGRSCEGWRSSRHRGSESSE